MEGQGPLDRTPLPADTNGKIYDCLSNERLPELGGAGGGGTGWRSAASMR